MSGTKIRTWQNGTVLGVAGNSTVGGAQIQYQNDTEELAQKWAIDPVTTDTFMLRNLNSDMCVTAVSGADSEALQQRPCDPRWEEQTFTLEKSNKPNRYRLRNVAHNKRMQTYSSSPPSHARVYACGDNYTYQPHSFDVR